MFESKMFFGVFFPKLGDSLTGFQRKCFQTVAQTAIYVSKEEAVVSKTWAGTFVFENLVFFLKIFRFRSKSLWIFLQWV